MGYKVKKIYIYQNGQEKQVRPSYIQEVITSPFNTRVNIAKTGYSIYSIQLNTAFVNPATTNEDCTFKIYNDINNGTRDAATMLRLGSRWGSTYYYGSNVQYGGIVSDGPSPAAFLDNFPSSATTSTNSACCVTFYKDKVNIKVGKAKGSRLYEKEMSYTTRYQENINSIFTASAPCVRCYGLQPTEWSAVITYTPN